MKVTLERLPESRVQMDIEVDQERVDKQFDAALRRMSQRARVPGFRPGKAPKAMVERFLGRERIMSEALDKLVTECYNEALDTEAVDAVAQPTLEKLDVDPVRFKFTVPVRPTVDLNDYQAIRVERQPVEVTEDEVAEQMLGIRRRNAIFAPVERPVTWNDQLVAAVKATFDGDEEPFLDQEDANFILRQDNEVLVAGFGEALIGAEKGKPVEFELTFPEDHRLESARGKAAKFSIVISEIKEEQLPGEDDELAATVSEEFESIEALRERIRADLEKSREQEEASRLQADAVARLVETATVEYPRVLVEHEIEHIIGEVMGQDRQQYNMYLQRIGRTDAEYRETFRDAAEMRVKRGLVLSKLTEAEGVEVTLDDVEAEIDRLIGPVGEEEDRQRFRQMFQTDDGLENVRRNLVSQRTLERLVAIAATDAPAAAEEPPKKPRAKKAAKEETE